MERRNFLGIAALLGLSPMLPRNVFTEEQGAPGIVKAQLADGTEFEFGESVDLSDNFKIEISDKITILQKKHGKYTISGKGFVDDGTEVSWLIKVRPGESGTNGKLYINGKDGYKVESVYQEAPQHDECLIDDIQHPRAIFFHAPSKAFIICKKI